MIWHDLHCILRLSTSGVWSIQNDVDHASERFNLTMGGGTGVIMDDNALRIYFDRAYDKAGIIQITPDDGFAGALTANASLGTQGARIELRTWPLICGFHAPAKPADVWTRLDAAAGRAVPRDNGNLWISVRMGLAG